ncbi:MAG TPA: alpha/beta hydrolase [Tepidimicrobium sp.]|nr:alpha/beta hydrolase [Tepidimicrobium sp.]
MDSTGLAAVFLLHGLNSGGEKEWGNMVSYLEATNDFITGGIIQGGTGFQNKKLFDSEDIVKIEKAIGVDFDKIKDTELLKPFIQAKVAELDEQGIDVLFMLDFTNNQGDFRNQGAELKKAIDLVNPKGHKANVLAHSMGSLGTASYISGISGVDYENDINTFIAIGAPFKGSSWAFAADLAGDFLPGDLRRHGTAYHNLRPDSKAINQLQKAWNNKSHNVNFHSLQCTAGDLVVSWNSSTSLKGGKNHGLTFTIHTRQTKNLDYQKATYQLLRNGTIEYNYTLKDLTWWERFRLNHLGPAYETMLWRLTR